MLSIAPVAVGEQGNALPQVPLFKGGFRGNVNILLSIIIMVIIIIDNFALADTVGVILWR